MNGPDDDLVIPEVSVSEAIRLVTNGSAILLDVREIDEWTAGHAEASHHVPLSSLELSTVPIGRPLVVICRSGNRSGQATRRLTVAGVDAANVVGGMREWEACGHPVVRDDGQPGRVI